MWFVGYVCVAGAVVTRTGLALNAHSEKSMGWFQSNPAPVHGSYVKSCRCGIRTRDPVNVCTYTYVVNFHHH